MELDKFRTLGRQFSHIGLVMNVVESVDDPYAIYCAAKGFMAVYKAEPIRPLETEPIADYHDVFYRRGQLETDSESEQDRMEEDSDDSFP